MLDELDVVSANQLLDDVSPRPLKESEKERLRNAAGRNPFFLIELAIDYCSRETESGRYDPSADVPSSVRQLVANRVDALSREARTLLQLLSVIGEIRVDAPLALGELSLTTFPDIADDLLRARLIDHAEGAITIRHDLIRQTTYDLMGPVKRAVLHRKVAAAVLQQRGEAAHGEAAIHFDCAGEMRASFHHATKAATAAQESGAVPEAIRFWEMARRNATGTVDANRATHNLAELLYRARRLEEAIPVLEAAKASADGQARSRFDLMRIDALSELPAAPQDSYLELVETVAQRARESGDWTQYAEAVEVLRWSRFFGQVVKVDSRAEEEAPRWPGRDGGSRRSSRHG